MGDDGKGGLLVLLFSIFSWCGSSHHLLFFFFSVLPPHLVWCSFLGFVFFFSTVLLFSLDCYTCTGNNR